MAPPTTKPTTVATPSDADDEAKARANSARDEHYDLDPICEKAVLKPFFGFLTEAKETEIKPNLVKNNPIEAWMRLYEILFDKGTRANNPCESPTSSYTNNHELTPSLRDFCDLDTLAYEQTMLLCGYDQSSIDCFRSGAQALMSNMRASNSEVWLPMIPAFDMITASRSDISRPMRESSGRGAGPGTIFEKTLHAAEVDDQEVQTAAEQPNTINSADITTSCEQTEQSSDFGNFSQASAMPIEDERSCNEPNDPPNHVFTDRDANVLDPSEFPDRLIDEHMQSSGLW